MYIRLCVCAGYMMKVFFSAHFSILFLLKETISRLINLCFTHKILNRLLYGCARFVKGFCGTYKLDLIIHCRNVMKFV